MLWMNYRYKRRKGDVYKSHSFYFLLQLPHVTQSLSLIFSANWTRHGSFELHEINTDESQGKASIIAVLTKSWSMTLSSNSRVRFRSHTVSLFSMFTECSCQRHQCLLQLNNNWAELHCFWQRSSCCISANLYNVLYTVSTQQYISTVI
jgi:hypothetical protein